MYVKSISMKNYTAVLPILSAAHSVSLLPREMGILLLENDATGAAFVDVRSPELLLNQ